MIDYCFFLSYPRIDRKNDPRDLIKQFYDDLNAKVIQLGHQEGGFFDTVGIEPGDVWSDELEHGLSWSRILVPLYSPNYFQGKYCGQEWGAFYERYSRYTKALPFGVNSAIVILPVAWIPEKLPSVVSDFQTDDSTYPAIYLKEGLEYMMARPKKFKTQYQDFLHTFGKRLVTMAREQGDPRVRPIPRLNEVETFFPKGFGPGPANIRLIFVAGRKDEMEKARARKNLDPYGDLDDRKDWRPCFPDVDRKAGDIAKTAEKELTREFHYLRPNVPLMQQLKEAETRNNTVIVLVDPWSTKIQAFQDFVNDFDKGDFANCGVVVTWPPKDEETNASMAALRTEVESIFSRRINQKTYYQDSVTSEKQLHDALIDAFHKIRAQLIERGKVKSPIEGPTQGRPILTTQTP